VEEGYFRLRKQEEIENVLKNKQGLIKRLVGKFDEIDNLPLHKLSVVKRPDCESQVVVLLTSLISNDITRSYIRYIDKIGHYFHHTSTNMICLDKDNNKILVEIEHKLSNLFKHDHPYVHAPHFAQNTMKQMAWTRHLLQ